MPLMNMALQPVTFKSYDDEQFFFFFLLHHSIGIFFHVFISCELQPVLKSLSHSADAGNNESTE